MLSFNFISKCCIGTRAPLRVTLRAAFATAPTALTNEQIKAASMRVIFPDPATGKNSWKIMDRSEALNFAKKLKLDLVLVNGVSDPVVCKVENYNLKVREKAKVIKENISSGAVSKPKPTKEVFIRGSIDPHDLSTKINRIKVFLAQGYPVKACLMEKKLALRKNPDLIREITVKLLKELESVDANVVQQRAMGPLRQDFLLTPKKIITEPTATATTKK